MEEVALSPLSAPSGAADDFPLPPGCFPLEKLPRIFLATLRRPRHLGRLTLLLVLLGRFDRLELALREITRDYARLREDRDEISLDRHLDLRGRVSFVDRRTLRSFARESKQSRPSGF